MHRSDVPSDMQEFGWAMSCSPAAHIAHSLMVEVAAPLTSQKHFVSFANLEIIGTGSKNNKNLAHSLWRHMFTQTIHFTSAENHLCFVLRTWFCVSLTLHLTISYTSKVYKQVSDLNRPPHSLPTATTPHPQPPPPPLAVLIIAPVQPKLSDLPPHLKRLFGAAVNAAWHC